MTFRSWYRNGIITALAKNNLKILYTKVLIHYIWSIKNLETAHRLETILA